MVACCSVGVSSVAAINQLLTTGRAYQPLVETTTACMQQNPSCAFVVDQVEQLKQQLQVVLENDDEMGALDQLARLESLALTKEVLETSRIGATVNEIRKSSAQRWPNVSKKCRGLIKSWQKLAEFHRPISSCEGSSNGATPNLVSPAFKLRGLTPRTPNKARITSTDSNSRGPTRLNDGLSSQNGSYAPAQKGKSISPFASVQAQMHKSISVGGALYSLKCSPNSIISDDGLSRDSLPTGADAQSMVAEKRKASDETSIAGLKRSKSSGVKLGASLASTMSVVAARKDVQSTAELVAQLSENLPQSMAIDLKHEAAELHRERSFPSTAHYTSEVMSKVSPPVEFSLNNPSGRPKRKYTKRAAKFFRNASDSQISSVDSVEDEDFEEPEHNGFTHQLSQIAEEEGPSTSSNVGSRQNGPISRLEGHRAASYNWFNSMPSMLDALKDCAPEYAQPHSHPTSSVVIPIRQRQVLLLPYCDIGLPDFLEHNIPEPGQYLAKSNISSAKEFCNGVQMNRQSQNK